MKTKSLLFNSFLIMIIMLFGCKSPQPLQTVEKVNLEKYAGTWYEIASFPQSFQEGCHCTTAEYKLTDKNYVRVINQCRKGSPQGKTDVAKGKAFPVKGSNNSKLKVQFFWPFRGNYWIIELADDYSYAVVGEPKRKYLWILSRTPEMKEKTYQMLLERIEKKGFDISKLELADQSCYK